MAIKDGFIKTKKRRKLTDGDYKAVSQWTSASTVEMADGQTVQKKIHDDIELHDISGTLDFANYNSESGQLNLARYNNKNGSPMTQKEFAQRISSSNQAIATAVNTGNSADKTVTFTSDDSTDTPTSTPPALITSGETHASLFNKISTAVKNVRWLLSKIGTTDLSGIGDGTVTNAISTLNSNINNKIITTKNPTPTQLKNASAITVVMNNGTSARSSVHFCDDGVMQCTFDVNGVRRAVAITWDKKVGSIGYNDSSCSTYAVTLFF